MHKYDSTKFRVVPFVEHIGNDVKRLTEFLKCCLGVNIKINHIDDFRYGEHEMALVPTEAHLLGLVDYLSTAEDLKKKCDERDPETREKRFKLLYGDSETRRQMAELAKAEIRNFYSKLRQGKKPKQWFLFEGFSKPDIFIDTDSCLIVGEGKWTEAKGTNETTFLEKTGRNQMVRHIQAALNYLSHSPNPNRPLIAFYIVDVQLLGKMDDLTGEDFKRKLSQEVIKPTDEEAARIIASYRGYTTWQAVSRLWPEIHFQSKEEIDGFLAKSKK